MTGKELQERIKKSGKTQRGLAEKMGMKPSQWTTYFKQESVTSSVIEQVAQLLGMSMGEFYGEDAAGKAACDSRLLGIIETRDRHIEKCQQQIDRLLDIIETNKQAK